MYHCEKYISDDRCDRKQWTFARVSSNFGFWRDSENLWTKLERAPTVKVHNLTKFDSHILQNRENILQSWEILQTFVGAAGGGGGGKFVLAPTQRTNVCKTSRLCEAILRDRKRQDSHLAVLLILRCSFQQCRQILVTWPISKVKKGRKGLVLWATGT